MIENKSLKIQYYKSQCSVPLNTNQSMTVSGHSSSLQMLEISVVHVGLFVTSLNICGSPLTEGNESQKLNCVRLKRYCANCSQMLIIRAKKYCRRE